MLSQWLDAQGRSPTIGQTTTMPMEKKPVTAALEDFASGKVRVRDLVKIKDAN